MAIGGHQDLEAYCLDVAERARRASQALARIGASQVVDVWLRTSAVRLRAGIPAVLEANQHDMALAHSLGLTEAQQDRLRLTPERVEALARSLEELALLPCPVGETIDATVRPSGLEVHRVRVPLGVVFFIYESRPNVTVDAAAICVKSGNAVILRGGKEAYHSSQALVDVLVDAAQEQGLPEHAVQLVTTPDRDAVGHFLRLKDWIDVAIPRGGEGLIRRVAAEATMPVIKHFAGNCHIYVDRSADSDMAERITVNAKCQRYGVCNACESLLVHSALAAIWLPRIGQALSARGVEIRGDEPTCRVLPDARPAAEADYFAEYLGPLISVKVVDSLEEAIRHINRYGSHHTDAIVTRDLEAARAFVAGVDSAAVMVNASTRLHDGSEFGLGAEIGISTDKLHARGPCGLRELTSYKYVAYGRGHLRDG